MRQNGLHRIQRPKEVHIHLTLGILQGGKLHRAGYTEAGIGDQHVYRAALRKYLGDSTPHGFGFYYIAVDVHNPVVRFAVTAQLEHAPAFLGKQHSGSQAYARTTACYY